MYTRAPKDRFMWLYQEFQAHTPSSDGIGFEFGRYSWSTLVKKLNHCGINKIEIFLVQKYTSY